MARGRGEDMRFDLVSFFLGAAVNGLLLMILVMLI